MPQSEPRLADVAVDWRHQLLIVVAPVLLAIPVHAREAWAHTKLRKAGGNTRHHQRLGSCAGT